jgi:hypothetical protein
MVGLCESRRAPQIIEKRETLNPDRTKAHFQFELSRSVPDGH